MKVLRSCIVAVLILAIFAPTASQAQNKKLDKSIRKADGYYKAGSFSKALKTLRKLKSGALKISSQNAYMLAFYVREARINLAIGLPEAFEASVANALTTSQAVFGESSTSFASTLLDVGKMYNEYGNYRLARQYIEKADALLVKTNQLDDVMKGKIALAKAEALIGQGFANSALELLNSVEQWFAARAVDKETVVENGQIKTTRLEESEVYARHNDYAELKILTGMALARKGRVSVTGSNADDPDVEFVFNELSNWLRGKKRYLGETSLAEVKYLYVWAKALVDNGNRDLPPFLEFDRTLNA
ncbi:MAG TPA: hypothetical protein VFI14_00405, partial [Chryseosolibacter sp.]|nr:hypothetical protein [Chryseosolibacter sp.]